MGYSVYYFETERGGWCIASKEIGYSKKEQLGNSFSLQIIKRNGLDIC